jgi:hypothetical protein
MVWVSPVRMERPGSPFRTTTHISVIVSERRNVQCRIFLACIDFLRARNKLTTLKLRDFAEAEIADFHWRNDHFKGFFPGGTAGRAQSFDIP